MQNPAQRAIRTALAIVTITAVALACQAVPETANEDPNQPQSATDQAVPAQQFAQPQFTEPPEQTAIPVSPEPTREFMTNRTIRNFAIRITDLVYVAAIGRIAESEPENLPHYIAERENHERCLHQTFQDSKLVASPERPLPTRQHQFTSETMATSLTDCFRQQAAQWSAAEPFDRATWIERILEATTRAKSPAEHYRTIHPQAADNDQWIRMITAYGQCNNIIPPQAEAIAVLPAEKVTPALKNAVTNVDHCMATVTEQEWPDLASGPPELPQEFQSPSEVPNTPNP